MIEMLLFTLLLAVASPLPVSVDVRDALGAAVAGAEVVVESGAPAQAVTTNADGRAEVAITEGTGEVLLTIRADGFAPQRRRVDPADHPDLLRVVLSPAALETTVTVTATRGPGAREGVVPSTSVLHAAELATAPGFTLDDALRQTPGFSLFRRSTSRVSNPTTQGVTLRGLTASGASRTLVLADGVPLNDPFGGWVSWNRVPLAAIDRVEVVRGSASDLYGPDALGGVVQLFTMEPSHTTVRLYADGGGQGTARASLVGAWRGRGLQVLGAIEGATSDGYVLVAREDRGPIDTKAGGDHRSGIVRVGGATRGWMVRAGGEVFREERGNGTPFQRNDTSARTGHAEVSGAMGGSFWRTRVFGGTQGYDQTFSAVNATRTAESPTQTQRVPSESYGFASDIAAGDRVRFLAGIEQRHVRANNQEVRFTAGIPVATTRNGGEQDFLGGFAQVVVEPHPAVSALVGLRVERWAVDSFQAEVIDDETLVAPRVSGSWRIAPALVLQGSVSRSYRAPTLNERFRGFRVGDTQTRPNALLDPERLTSGEIGASLTRGRVGLRGTAFINRLDDAIANVTVSATPTLITRDRRNAGAIQARGLELEASLPLVAKLRGTFATTIVRSRFGSGAPAGLEGNRTPQSPTYQSSADVVWDDLPSIAVALRLQVTGAQFEDDRNSLTLERATSVDLMASRAIARGWLVFAAGENLLDEDYDVGRTPLRTVGSPRLFRVGLRWSR